MYYITNQNNQIIAIDPSLSALLEVENIDEFYRGVALGDLKFSSSTEEGKVTIATAVNEKTYDATYHNLSSMLGDLTLVQIQISAEAAASRDKEESVEDLLNIDLNTEDEMSLLHDDMISIKDTQDLPEDDIDSLIDLEEKDDALFDLISPKETEDTIDEISLVDKEEKETLKDDQSPIAIDIEEISQSIGISTEDYNIFLNEYIDTALSLEKDLHSTQDEKRASAIGTLSHLSNVLHLPVISEIITQIENTTADDQGTYIESFYTTLARLTTSPVESDTADTHVAESLVIDNIDLQEEELKYKATTKSFGTINLDDVKPIHFDFQLEQAANELSLPIELIEEFVHDFIAQAHTETEKMLAAYEKGDLETIQQIGHLLKGTSSNLRINPLADTLYEIQFCEDSSKLEAMIKHYWGHFLSLETQIDITTKK